MGKKGKKKDKISLEQFDTTPLTKEQLVALAIRIQQETKKEQDARNFFMMERDKLRAFWEVTRKQLDDARAELRDKDHRLDDEDIDRLSEIKFHEQKILWTMLENQRALAEMKIENMEVLHRAQQDNLKDYWELRKDKLDMLEKNKEQETIQQQSIYEANLLHSSTITSMRDHHSLSINALSSHFERLTTQLRQELLDSQKNELQEASDRQKAQVEKLLEAHAGARNDLKNYYNEITLNNLSLVATLKAQCGDLREREERAVQLARSLRAENRNLAGPLKEAREELHELNRQMAHFDRDQADLERAVSHANACQRELRDARWELDVVNILYEQVRDDRDRLLEQLRAAQAAVRLSRAHAEVRDEMRVRELFAALEQRHAEAAVCRHAAPTCQRLLSLKPLMDEKDKRIAGLVLEVSRLQKSQDTALKLLRVEMLENGKDFDDGLRFQPPRAVTPDHERTHSQQQLPPHHSRTHPHSHSIPHSNPNPHPHSLISKQRRDSRKNVGIKEID